MFQFPQTTVPIMDGDAAGRKVTVALYDDGAPQPDALVTLRDGLAVALDSDALVLPPGNWVAYTAQQAPDGGWEYVMASDGTT